jgi:hypothetical protein
VEKNIGSGFALEAWVGARTYGITNSTFRSVGLILVVAYAIFLLIMFFRAESDAWAILVIPTLPLLPLAYVLHKGNLAWLQIKEQEIEVIPSWFRRTLWSEPIKTIQFDFGSELVFCRRLAYRSFDGFYLILRSPSGADQTLWSTNDNSAGVSRKWWARIAQEIDETSQLKTKLIQQTVSSEGMRESDWPTSLNKTVRQGLRALIVPAVSPWLGIGARLLTADPAKLAGAGVLLFVGIALWILYWIRPLRGKLPGYATARILILTLQFATFYTLSVLVTGAFLRH